MDNPTPAQIKAARLEKGMSQVAAAGVLGVTPLSWKRWEYGEFRMKRDTWEKFLTAAADVPKAPTPTEIKNARLDFGLTQTVACKLVYCQVRQWQKYEAGDIVVPPAVWELFLIKASANERSDYATHKDNVEQ